MAKNDKQVDELSEIELKISELQAQAETLRNERRGAALNQARELVRQFDFTARELGINSIDSRAPVSAAKTRKPAVAKYAHPDDANLTWAGRGRKPSWLDERLKAGANIDDFLIVR